MSTVRDQGPGSSFSVQTPREGLAEKPQMYVRKRLKKAGKGERKERPKGHRGGINGNSHTQKK